VDQKIQIINRVLKENKVDMLILVSDINRQWFNGVESDFGFNFFTKNKSYILMDPRDIDNAIKFSPKESEKVLCKSYQDFIDLVKRLKPNSILVEGDLLTLKQYDNIIKPLKIKNVKLFNSIEIRSVKTKSEIELMHKSAEIACKGIEHLKKWIKPGISEKEAARELLLTFIKNGATKESFPAIVLFGDHSSDIHGIPTDRKYKKGENILVDCGCVYQNYMSDITRCWGSTDSEIKKIYNIVLNANLLGLKLVKNGVAGNDVDKKIREFVQKSYNNYDIPHGIGHGVGLVIHENPRISKLYNNKLATNMIVTVEPGIYIPGLVGIRVEDTIVVTKTGNEVLTKLSSKKY